ETHDANRRAAERVAEIGWIEHPNVRTRNARRRQLRIAGAGDVGNRRIGALLSAMRGRDKGALRGAGEHDVAWFIADQKRAGNMRRTAQRYDADAIGKMIDYPDFIIVSHRHRDRFHADRYFGGERQSGRGDIENREPVVWRVDGE